MSGALVPLNAVLWSHPLTGENAQRFVRQKMKEHGQLESFDEEARAGWVYCWYPQAEAPPSDFVHQGYVLGRINMLREWGPPC